MGDLELPGWEATGMSPTEAGSILVVMHRFPVPQTALTDHMGQLILPVQNLQRALHRI